MDQKILFRAASATLAVGVATAALVACGGGSSGEGPTTVVSSAETDTTLSSSDLTTSDDGTNPATSPDDRPQGPPEEALAACDGLATGTSCSFEAPFGTVAGTCSAGVGDSSQVACRPEWADGERPSGPGGSGPGPGGQAPQQAIAACEGLLVDTACSFESPLGTLSGVCRTGRDGSSLVCAPSTWPSR